MSVESTRDGRESFSKEAVTPPAVESLLSGNTRNSPWPRAVIENDRVQKEGEQRRVLCGQLDRLYANLPAANTRLEDAVAMGTLSEREVAHLYDSFTTFLGGNTERDRLALYLPLEFIPDLSHAPKSEELVSAKQRFADTYLHSWRNLLSVHDVRANFVDGDVLEPEKLGGDYERVVKAAHLIPALVERQLISVQEVIAIAATTRDETLRNSIAETIPLLAEKNLVSAEDREYLTQSGAPELAELCIKISTGDHSRNAPTKELPTPIDPSTMSDDLDDAFSKIDALTWPNITPAREQWLRKEEKRILIDAYANRIAHHLSPSTSESDALQTIVRGTSIDAQIALVRGIRVGLEARDERAKQSYEAYAPLFRELWNANNHELKDELTSAYCRLAGRGIIPPDEVQALGILPPNLGGLLIDNIPRMHSELRDIRAMVAEIEANAELSGYVYPTALVFGSRLKGYGTHTADLDVAVFVRPGTAITDRPHIKALLKETFGHEKIDGKVVQFWLEEKDGGLVVKDIPELDPTLGESSWAHVLFGATWCGDTETTRELHEKVLTHYLHATEATIAGRNARSVWLEEMERDALQYRLMHKGYARFYPPQGGIESPYADLIDGASTFWDSGYRRVATKLFVTRTFLPTLEA